MAAHNTEFKITQERRPCLVRGCRAFFHRWADTARPVVPHGVERTEEAQRYQLHNVSAIVEYADGRVERVWPSDIQFLDGGFDEYDWSAIEEQHASLPWTFGVEEKYAAATTD